MPTGSVGIVDLDAGFVETLTLVAAPNLNPDILMQFDGRITLIGTDLEFHGPTIDDVADQVAESRRLFYSPMTGIFSRMSLQIKGFSCMRDH